MALLKLIVQARLKAWCECLAALSFFLFLLPTSSLAQPIPVAVLGDSDSHSYRDNARNVQRGGDYHEVTFNWLEVWGRLRPGEVDLGEFRRAGARRIVARTLGVLGFPTKTPVKEDYEFSYAISGARCASLNNGWPHQTEQFVRQIRANRELWRRGILFIRIGINDFGQVDQLKNWVSDSEKGHAAVDKCLGEIQRSIETIRDISTVRIVLVGVAREQYRHGAEFSTSTRDDLARVEAVLEAFDKGLRRIAKADLRVHFVHGHSWFLNRFRNSQSGKIEQQATVGGVRVLNAMGDMPANLLTSDNHAGTIASGLFLQDVVSQINDTKEFNFTPVADDEIISLVQGSIDFDPDDPEVSDPTNVSRQGQPNDLSSN